MNVFNFTANLGGEPILRYTADNTAILGFTAAVSSGYGDKKVTTWVNCSIFGKRADTLAPMLRKGSKVAISGELTNRPYTDKAGAEKHSLDVRVNDLTLLDARSESGGVQTERAESDRHDVAKEPHRYEQETAFDDLDKVPF